MQGTQSWFWFTFDWLKIGPLTVTAFRNRGTSFSCNLPLMSLISSLERQTVNLSKAVKAAAGVHLVYLEENLFTVHQCI